jgi:hypothetical protein
MTNSDWPRLVVLISLIGLASCTGDSGNGTPDTTAPRIVSISPTDGQTDTKTTLGISVTFSEAIDPVSFDPVSTFTVEEAGAGLVSGTIRINGVSATFIPAAFLQPSTTYTVTITTGIKDLTGNALANGQQWSFTTGTLRAVMFTWDANREAAVNQPGGGYRLYYSTNSGFALADPGVDMIEVAYVSGALAPTTALLQLHRTNYYFRVVAYSALTAPWGSGGSSSEPSAQVTVLVP